MAGKKDKTRISKRRQKAKQQKVKKRKLRLIKGGGGDTSGPAVAERPGMPHLGAPEGFRSISFSQAIMEYGAPLMEQAKNEKAMNAALQLSGLLWNYSKGMQDGKIDQKMEKETVKGIKSALGLSLDETQQLIKRMVDRYDYLFPKNIQPPPPPLCSLEKRFAISSDRLTTANSTSPTNSCRRIGKTAMPSIN
jgi:hypothetical protein